MKQRNLLYLTLLFQHTFCLVYDAEKKSLNLIKEEQALEIITLNKTNKVYGRKVSSI